MDEHWTDRLSDYLDGVMEAGDAASLEAHVATCTACRVTLEELRQVIEAAAALEDEAPQADLWPGILEGMRTQGDVPVMPLRRSAASRRFSFSLAQLAAAALVLMAVSGGAVWMVARGRSAATETIAQTDVPDSPDESAARFVTETEKNYDTAIRELEGRLAAFRDQLDSTTIAVVERNLQTIDQAIGEAKAALARDPSNAWLYRHLDDTMMKKVELLRRATSLPRSET